MIKVYREHPEFGEFCIVDSEKGFLKEIGEDEYRAFLPADAKEKTIGTQVLQGKGAVVFTGETPPTRTRFTRRVYFQITRNCCLQCDFCFIKAKKGQPPIPLEAASKMARLLGGQGLVEARLTGGEPTTHPDLFEIVRAFQDAGVYVSLATNGVFSKRVRERLAEQNLWVICSIDGDRDTHNHYRPGTFDTILENLRYMKNKNPGMRLRLTTVLTRRNKGQMRQLGRICRDLDAESITVIPLRPQVRDPEAAADMIDAGQFEKVLRELVEVKHELGVKFTTTLETEFAEEIYRDPVFRKRSSCAAGREGTNLDYDAASGRFFLYGCSYCPASDLDAAPALRTPFVAGSFPAEEPHKFLEIWRDDKAWKLFRDLDIRWCQCKNCQYYKRACTGSCPIQNLDYSKIDMDADVLEQLRRQIAGTAEWYCYKNILG